MQGHVVLCVIARTGIDGLCADETAGRRVGHGHGCPGMAPVGARIHPHEQRPPGGLSRQAVAHDEVHGVGPRAGQSQVEIAVTIEVGPRSAVRGVQPPDGVGCHVREPVALVPEQEVGVLRAAGERAVHVGVWSAVMIDVGERAGVMAAIDGCSPRPRHVFPAPAAAIEEEAVGPVVGREDIQTAVAINVFPSPTTSPIRTPPRLFR